MLILTNEEIEQLLTAEACLEALEVAYREMGEGRAINRPRSDMYMPTPDPETYYVFKTMAGAVPGLQVAALRLCSDHIRWKKVAGFIRKDKMPVLPGNRWLGLILLFSARNAELLGIIPDGYIQKMRVGASCAIAARHLSRQDARVLGLLGSGWQAGAHLDAICAVRPVQLVKVYSPNADRRRAFAEEWARRRGIEVRALDQAEEVVRGADIVVAATDAIEPVLKAEWVEDGAFVGCVKHYELGPELGDRRIEVHDPVPILIDLQQGKQPPAAAHEVDWGAGLGWAQLAELGELVNGKATGRTSPRQITCFLNSIGIGIQFAAVAAKVYELARAKGLGRDLPIDWFVESVHN
ncbi:MAG: ornithine cyclodeaminase family protein [Deltaproteobacteria bacterium]|nr:ornithine cyclodeaminase family protein [Deltaproteobacteria bacterium]